MHVSPSRNPGRVAGIWYLLLIVVGLPGLAIIPGRLFVRGNAAATVANIAAHERLFRFGILSDIAGAVILIFLVMAFYRLFEGVDRNLAALVVIFGGVMPAVVAFVNVVGSFGALMIAKEAGFLSIFDPPQREALAMLLLRLRDHQDTAAETLWGVWLFPLGTLVYRSRFLPRFLGVWLVLGGCGWIAVSLAGILLPDNQDQALAWAQPLCLSEVALVLWLLVRGARPLERTTGAALR